MASSSSSSGGMSNMSRLMASSRLSSYHPKVPQVYTAPPSYIARGDFGVKRPLPTRHIPLGKVRYVDFANLDTRYRQTDWREREREVLMLKRFSELNVKLTSTNDYKGPKISTRYDYSTKRMVPTDYKTVPDEDIRLSLQRQARLGNGPVFAYDNMNNTSLSQIKGYSDQPEIRFNYRTMNENRFERYIEEVRGKRESFKDFLANRAAELARDKVALQYKSHREKAIEEAARAETTGATIVPVPEEISEKSLPLLKRSEEETDSSIQIDLWDEARLIEHDKTPWEPWLKSQDTSPIRMADNQLLPLRSNRKGGHEIPTPLHIHGGLQYGQPDTISTQLLYGSLPARVLGFAREESFRNLRRNPKSLTQEKSVAIGGRIATMDRILSDNSRPIDASGTEPGQGNIRVKVLSAVRDVDQNNKELNPRFPPANDSRLPPQYGNTIVTVRASDRSDQNSMAKGVPGSTEWIARVNGHVRFSGQGQDAPLDIADMESMASNRKALDVYTDNQRNFRASPEEKRRRERKTALQSPSSSSQRNFSNFWDTMGEAASYRRGRKTADQRSTFASRLSKSSNKPATDEAEFDPDQRT